MQNDQSKKNHIYIADASLFVDLSEKHKKMHQHLSEIVKDLPEDYEPYGQQKRNGDYEDNEEQLDSRSGWYGDCSSGCKWFAKLEGDLGMDWGVCTNPASHRVGLLTFEHQGCYHGFEPEENEE